MSPPESKTLPEKAEVFKGGVHAGRLQLTPNTTEFNYLPEYLEGPLPAVASTLPKTDEPIIVTRRAVPPFFAGLLPEGRRLTALRQAKKISVDDEFTLLLEVGEDTVGDVQILPPGAEPENLPPAAELPPDEQADFDHLAGITIADRVGLPGVQDKVSGQMVSLPVMRDDRRYILKLNPPEYPDVVENEAYFLSLARRCGLNTVDAVVVHDKKGQSGLLVTRFDRVASNESVQRLAVEDGCQCMGKWPGDKYSVTTEELFSVVASRCSSQPVARRDLFRQWLFALLSGNGDLHAKNVSVLWSDGTAAVSPTYDIPSTVPYGDMTMALSAADKLSNFSRRQVLELAESLQVNPRVAEGLLDGLLESTETLEEELRAGALPLDVTRLRTTVKQLRFRRQLLTK